MIQQMFCLKMNPEVKDLHRDEILRVRLRIAGKCHRSDFYEAF
jgi:hypothetical protein